jgi:hypothetical protein
MNDIESLSEEEQIEYVQEEYFNIQDIRDPSYRVKEAAIQAHGWSIMYIKDVPEELQLKALEQDYDLIRYINNPSRKVQMKFAELIQVEDDDYHIKYITIDEVKKHFYKLKNVYKVIK